MKNCMAWMGLVTFLSYSIPADATVYDVESGSQTFTIPIGSGGYSGSFKGLDAPTDIVTSAYIIYNFNETDQITQVVANPVFDPTKVSFITGNFSSSSSLLPPPVVNDFEIKHLEAPLLVPGSRDEYQPLSYEFTYNISGAEDFTAQFKPMAKSVGFSGSLTSNDSFLFTEIESITGLQLHDHLSYTAGSSIQLNYNYLQPVPTTPPTGPVPEPSTWAMLIAGFGVIGTAMRGANSAATRGRRKGRHTASLSVRRSV